MHLKGSFVAIVTPMDVSGEVDFDAFLRLLDWHSASGTKGIVVLGTTGESPTVTSDERIKLIQIAVKHSSGRYPVIVGTGTNSTASTILLTEQAKALGADAALVVVPYYNKPTQVGLFQHFMAVADATDFPIMLYKVPGRTVADLSHDTVVKLSHHPRIIGLKDASGDLSRITPLRRDCGESFVLFSGNDDSACAFMLTGGDGVISVVANVLPLRMAALCDAALSFEVEKARLLDRELSDFHRLLFVEANPIPTKFVLHRMGKIPAGIRLPLTSLSAEAVSKIQPLLLKLGVRCD